MRARERRGREQDGGDMVLKERQLCLITNISS